LALFDQEVLHEANPASPDSRGVSIYGAETDTRSHRQSARMDEHLPDSIETTLARPKPRQR
jgi:hypothetical protein